MKITGISKLIFVLALSMFLAKTVWCQTVSSEDARPTRYGTTSGNQASQPSIECYGGSASSKQPRIPLSVAQDTDTITQDECTHIAALESQLASAGSSQEAYDTGRAFLTLCYNVFPVKQVVGMFSAVSGDNGSRNNDTNRFVEYREWLKSVLYLRTDTEWYCADVFAMLSTFDFYPGHGIYDAGAEAVVRYILDHQRCDSLWTNEWFKKADSYWPNNVLTRWRDTVKDSLTEPRPDTTVPSIDSIGLSILRGPQYAGIQETLPPPGTEEISSLSATENPFTNTTAIKFDLADYGLVTFQLYDLLGNAVTTNGIGQVLYPGAHEFDIDGSKLAAGMYIARVAFHDGEVKSIMLVKKQ